VIGRFDELRLLCERLDGRPYPYFKDLKGSWDLNGPILVVDFVQGDPYAEPSRVRLRVQTDLSTEDCTDPDRRLAAEDWLLRRFAGRLRGGRRGSGRSGVLEVYRPGPEITERSALRLAADGWCEVRFGIGLPAKGRRILGRQAWEMFSDDLTRAAAQICAGPGLSAWVDSVVVQRGLRRQLRGRGLVAFVANGSVLPRISGIDQSPLPKAVAFESPPSLEVSLDTPGGPVAGLGIPIGITLIVGGGFHGKSTLLNALQRGHLDHVPGDGRQGVVTDPDTVKIRAEDGRRVTGVDISPFLGDLPGDRSTRPFYTDDASGSTSQAAALVEAVESGARVLLIDEDTSATNLLVRDVRMRSLIPRELEPITPLVERIREICQDWEMSLLMVVGGVGDYLSVADTVIGMHDFCPADLSERARSLAVPVPLPPQPILPSLERTVIAKGLEPDGRVRARNTDRVQYGQEDLDLRAVEQVLDASHASTLGHALRLVYQDLVRTPGRPMGEILDRLEVLLRTEGLEILSPRSWPDGGLVMPRRHEVAAAMNRLRSLRLADS
jgi:predicted ABC-class ATPase